MIKPAKFLARADINGKSVSFFTPPHDEPDFVWVDLDELALAFLPPDKARRMLQVSQQRSPVDRGVTTAVNGARIATIGCHSVAQGFCAAIDAIGGHLDRRRDGFSGPALTSYCFAAAEVEADHGGMTFEAAASAAQNIGGPFVGRGGEA